MENVYKILTTEEYKKFEEEKVFYGSPIDIKDGFIHLSFKNQISRTTSKFFANEKELYILEFEGSLPHLKVESLKNPPGEKFPHFYDVLKWEDIKDVCCQK